MQCCSLTSYPGAIVAIVHHVASLHIGRTSKYVFAVNKVIQVRPMATSSSIDDTENTNDEPSYTDDVIANREEGRHRVSVGVRNARALFGDLGREGRQRALICSIG